MQRVAVTGEGRGGGIGPWRATASGLCATLVGIGLARFAYTPLLPALIEAEWFSVSGAAYLGAANLAGYLAGALIARPAASRATAPTVIRTMLVVATASFFACAVPLSFLWYFAWRFLSGLSGGILMVLAAPLALSRVPAHRQGLAGGIIFTGVGLGIAASGTIVPLVLRTGPAALRPASTAPAPAPGSTGPTRPARPNLRLRALYLEYGLIAAGLVPHMVFLVDFIARGLGAGLNTGAVHWVLFGLGAVCGPALAGAAADRIGFQRTLRLGCLVQAACVGVLAVSDNAVGLAISSIVIGAFVPGIVPIVLGRVRELAPGDVDAQQAGWSIATIAFALGQAGGAYGFSFLLDRTGSYVALFALGFAALILALAVDIAAAVPGAIRRERPPMIFRR
jgi:predicted MFS family arabinose efflux permease